MQRNTNHPCPLTHGPFPGSLNFAVKCIPVLAWPPQQTSFGVTAEVMMMLQHLIADAKEMEMESSAAEREAQKDYEIFGKERPWTVVGQPQSKREEVQWLGELVTGLVLGEQAASSLLWKEVAVSMKLPGWQHVFAFVNFIVDVCHEFCRRRLLPSAPRTRLWKTRPRFPKFSSLRSETGSSVPSEKHLTSFRVNDMDQEIRMKQSALWNPHHFGSQFAHRQLRKPRLRRSLWWRGSPRRAWKKRCIHVSIVIYTVNIYNSFLRIITSQHLFVCMTCQCLFSSLSF